MDKERDAILSIHKALGNTDEKEIFETDAQAFTLDGNEYLFSTDEYSSEDLFNESNPKTLGWNLTIATLSDILAAGGDPLYFSHSMSIPPEWGEKFLFEFSKGIKKCLDLSGVRFLGGDTGLSHNWKYTGIAIGEKCNSMSRNGASPGDTIYMTGKVGSGNLQAASNIYGDQMSRDNEIVKMNTEFQYRGKEAAIIRKYATSCIDSSDGLLKSLINLVKYNNLGFQVDHLAILEVGVKVCQLLGIDPAILFIGECGEYELVCTIPSSWEAEFHKECKAQDITMSRLGTIKGSQNYILNINNFALDFFDFDIHARNFSNISDYIIAVKSYLEQSSPPD